MGLLNELGKKYRTDKCSDENFGHGYLDTYEIFLQPLRYQDTTLIEIGVGGEDNPDVGGHSIHMWEEYFLYGTIIGVDLHYKSMVRNFLQASQDDAEKLNTLPDAHIIIDDASHINNLSIKTFGIMWPKLLPGGFYILEDIHTSYFEGFGYGGSIDPEDKNTAMAFINKLSHQLQYDSLHPRFRVPYCHELEFIHHFRNTVIIKKKAAI